MISWAICQRPCLCPMTRMRERRTVRARSLPRKQPTTTTIFHAEPQSRRERSKQKKHVLKNVKTNIGKHGLITPHCGSAASAALRENVVVRIAGRDLRRDGC